jgi:hypothetical protein
MGGMFGYQTRKALSANKFILSGLAYNEVLAEGL